MGYAERGEGFAAPVEGWRGAPWNEVGSVLGGEVVEPRGQKGPWSDSVSATAPGLNCYPCLGFLLNGARQALGNFLPTTFAKVARCSSLSMGVS